MTGGLSTNELGRRKVIDGSRPTSHCLVMSRNVIVAVVLVVVSVKVMEFVIDRLVEANGSHARDHLASAKGAGPLIALLAVMFWTTS